MKPRIILNSKKLSLTLNRLCYQLIENHKDFSNSALIGIQPRGIYLSDRIYKRLYEITKQKSIAYGKLDVTFYRDDFRRKEKPLAANSTNIDFSIENKRIVLIDDVFYTGRMVRSAMDALLDFGRPAKVELLVLIDRRFSRHLPIQPDYVGRTVDSIESEKVKVEWGDEERKNKVWILTE